MTDHRQTAALALAKCAAYDPWFPKASQATVDAWSEAIGEYQLETRDVLDGVKLAYRDNGSGFRPLPRDIVQAARAVRRERAERETADERKAREDRRDARLASRIHELAERKAIPDA